MLPLRVHFIVALVMASVAFGIGQAAPGMGVPFAALASTIWTAVSVGRKRRMAHRG